MAERKIVIYIDMDDVLCNYTGAYEKARSVMPEIKYPQSVPGFFRNLEPIEGAIEGYKYLSQQVTFDVYILTAPSVENPLCYTEKRLWIEDHLSINAVKKLIIASNKSLLKGQYLIDDYDKGRGQEAFEGQLIHFGSPRFLTWTYVIERFKQEFIN